MHQRPPAQEIEARSSIHLSLDQLQAGDLTFCLSIAPGRGQSSTNRIGFLGKLRRSVSTDRRHTLYIISET